MTAVRRYAVFGHPVAHSLSPHLHALFAEQTGIALEYTAIDAAPDVFGHVAREFFTRNGCGANVTLPHKAAAYALADVRTPAAQRLGVANVLTVLPDGRVEAGNNDGAGMIADMRDRLGCDPRGRDVLLLGAGGAARAAAFALLEAGARNLAIANRTPARARALVDALSGAGGVRTVAWPELENGGPFDLVVNATSAGVQHAALRLPPRLVHADTFAYDLGYGPAARPFIEWAQAAGCGGEADGLGMLVETAAASFHRWHGVRPDAEAAFRAIHAGIRP
jgi:shikimate dehydrogenase